MANTSATGGYLAATGQPAYGDALDSIFQALIVNLSGLSGNMVRPRWQATPPKQPEPDVNWCAIGVMEIQPNAGPALTHDNTANGGVGDSTSVRHEHIRVQASFYGPDSMSLAAIVRDTISLPQNNELINQDEIFFHRVDNIQPVPELVNLQWIKRYDLPLEFNRKVAVTFPIENIEEADFTISTNDSVVVHGSAK